MIITKTPFRITLAGGGTDLPSFYKNHGGIVATMAIDKHIYVNFKPNILDRTVRLQYLKTEIVEDTGMLEHERASESLIKHDIAHSIEISSMADLPSQSGLGSSGSYLVGLLNAIRTYKKMSCEPDLIAEEACEIEIETLKEPVGKQDQYIASHGGVKILDISKGGKVSTRDVNISTSSYNDFLSHIGVYHIGKSRNASEILKNQNKASDDVVERLKKIKELGYNFIDCLETCNFEKYGLLLHEHWQNKKRMSSKISLPLVEKIYEELKLNNQILGGKIIGAGGGGFLLLFSSPGKTDAIEEKMKTAGMKRLHFCADYQGSRVILNSFNSHYKQIEHGKNT